MSLKSLVEFCERNSIDMGFVSFWHGYKEVYALFDKGSIPGILYPDEEGFWDWYVEDKEGYGPPELQALGKDDYVHFNSDYDCLVMRIA